MDLAWNWRGRPQGITLLEVPVIILAIKSPEKSNYHIEMAASWIGAVFSEDLSK
jgi:hypothetical protein